MHTQENTSIVTNTLLQYLLYKYNTTEQSRTNFALD